MPETPRPESRKPETSHRETPQNEAIIQQLKDVRETLAPEEWRDARIYRHIDEYKLDFTLIATKISSGQLHYYVPDTGVFEPLNLNG
jgi:hypothetical protein